MPHRGWPRHSQRPSISQQQHPQTGSRAPTKQLLALKPRLKRSFSPQTAVDPLSRKTTLHSKLVADSANRSDVDFHVTVPTQSSRHYQEINFALLRFCHWLFHVSYISFFFHLSCRYSTASGWHVCYLHHVRTVLDTLD